MPVRQRLREFRRGLSSRLDALFPSRSAAQSSVSLPNAPVSNSPFTHSRDATDLGPETNVPTLVHANATIQGQASASLPALVLSRATGEVASLFRQPSVSELGQTGEQSTTLHEPQAEASNAVATAPATSAQGASIDSWSGLRAFFRMLGQAAGVFGPLKAVVDELVECIGIYDSVASGRDDFKALQIELEVLFEGLRQHFSPDTPPTMTTSMESMCNSIQRELSYVKGKQARTTARRDIIEAKEDADRVLACYRRIHGHLRRLSLNANLTLWKIVDEQTTDARLDRLCPSMSACYNSRQATELRRGACTPGTRVDVLGGMHDWAYNRGEGSVYWLNGMAGTGKTTIAYSLCVELDAAHNLGASFFCSRTLPECRDVNQIVPSIAYQLAHFSRPFRWALSRVLEKDRNVHTQLLHIQFDKLVVKPLVEVRDALPEDLVVVIDALDECDNKKSTSHILEALLTKTSDLPLKVFLASRPEPEIRDQMKKQGGRQAIARLVLHELDKGTVQADIETYLREALSPIQPSELEIADLVQRAGILFIYAATVARYIGYDNFSKNPRTRLNNVLNVSSSGGKNPYKEIDELYTLILQAALDDPGLEDQDKDETKQILYTALCAREPLTIGAMSGLLGFHAIERVEGALRPLWSVLHVVESSGLVTTLHASFPDYMFDPQRSRSYCCDLVLQDQTLALCCFDCIKNTKPRFNICGLESSYVTDEKVANLRAKIEKSISPELSYACKYWLNHLQGVAKSPDMVERLEEFLQAHLLLWMEVMNLNNWLHTGLGMIKQAEDWSQGCSDDLTRLAHDAWRFVTGFASSPASRSTPHLYVSMLLFWPAYSSIAKSYARHIQPLMEVQGSALTQRKLELLSTWSARGAVCSVAWSADGGRLAFVAEGRIFTHDSVTGEQLLGPLNKKRNPVRSIAFSSDGARIVSGSEDGTIRVWGTQDGKKLLGPLKGHKGSVNCVGFSSDGSMIVSGSGDMTIRIWDAQEGKIKFGPLKGHTEPVNSVAFAPEDTRIVSGADDHTVRLWDARNRQTPLGPFNGHTGAVYSVAFSPDGTHIVSGSGDKTIRMWNAQSGQTSLAPFKGHTNSVRSVAFSPNGTRIVSGSVDKTIRMWDSRSGETVLGPLDGHASSVHSVLISPDGTRIVSGSEDKTIRMWDAKSGQTALSSLQGHTSPVRSVAFSPDGTRVVSGSDGKTIRMWDAQSGQTVLGPLRGHTSLVLSVVFSPDGTRIVSGSLDKTIRMWDAQSGQTVLGPLEGHTDSVRSVAFSPDGTRIVSGSSDKTIRMWDAQSGQMVLGPLEGHTHWVLSGAFSPDGTRIVSGSGDKTIRMWDAQSGQTVLGPLEGHTHWVWSVAFSPDGTRTVSGSRDNTIRMWDAQNGKMVLGPLEGHTNSVRSVAFSPDGARIVSGSDDGTIRMWDAQSGQVLLGPFEGHTMAVNSVAFSPDGTRIVSGSEDNTVRMWDVRNRLAAATSSGSSSSIDTPWRLNPDGWVTDGNDESRLLVWVPSDLRASLITPYDGSWCSESNVYLNFGTSRIGESWTECYQPT